MSTLEILDGKTLALELRSKLRFIVVEKNITPTLAVILVGNDPASELYVNLKTKAAQEIGIMVSLYRFPTSVTESELCTTLDWLNQDTEIDAILVQLPLPEHIDENKIIEKIDPKKDADGFHPHNLKSFLDGTSDIAPAPAHAAVRLMVAASFFHANSDCLVIANNPIFFKPIQKMLTEYHLSTTYAEPDDPALFQKTQNADVIVLAVGRPGFLTGSHIKDDVILIDLGTNKKNNTTVGDVDITSVRDIAGALTPVPGGVGPMTIACLLENVITLCLEKNK